MKHLAELANGGFITDNFHHEFLESMVKERDAIILAIAGDKTIISGVEIELGSATTGVVVYSGKLYSFIPGEVQDEVTIKRISIDRPNANGVPAAAYYEDVIEFGNDGLETFDFDELSRVKSLKEIIIDETLVNAVPSWDDVTGKPNFLNRRIYGKVSLGDTSDVNNSNFAVTGDITSATVLATGSGTEKIKINFASLGTSNYLPSVLLVSKSSDSDLDDSVLLTARNIQSNSFEVLLREINSEQQNLDLIVQIII